MRPGDDGVKSGRASSSSQAPALRSVLIANRGEIAVRIARACAELGIRSVAVASDADLGACHTRYADEVVPIGGSTARDSYLRAEVILDAARSAGCDAIHPGYGFLSQNADFADAVEAAGLLFVGPPGAAMRVMGDKTSARSAMEAAGVPVVPGYQGTGDEEADALRSEAKRVGFPLLVKAAAGGGGRGMRIVREPREFDAAVDGARREALAAFGDGRLFMERFVENAHHVEIQVLADGHGNTIHLRERECSVQRRYQKVIEESPSPLVDDELRERMGMAAVRAAEACGYRNAGTVEFLLSEDGSFYFLEMNTRLQVEHPVTELVTGIDIVAEQLRIAAGGRLSLRQEDVRGHGHAIECRVNAEDPQSDFAPSTGPIRLASYPRGPGVRVDQGVETGDAVSIHYDSMIAKVLVHAHDRPSAIARMQRALDQTAVLGVRNNVTFMKDVLAHPEFVAGRATTTFIDDFMAGWRGPDEVPDVVLIAAALQLRATGGADNPAPAVGAGRSDPYSPWDRGDGYRIGGGA